MPDPTPKTPGRRSRGRSPARSSAVVKTVPGAGPPAKRTWLAMTRDAWVEYWASPVSRTIVSSDLAGLRRLFEWIDVQERFRRAGMRKPTSLGSTGQLVLHPLLKAAMDLEPKIDALAARYGADPRGRLALTVGLGDAARSLADATNEEILAGDVEPIDLYSVDGGAG